MTKKIDEIAKQINIIQDQIKALQHNEDLYALVRNTLMTLSVRVDILEKNNPKPKIQHETASEDELHKSLENVMKTHGKALTGLSKR